ncbi:hypothetical protein [Vibrio mediterranei]|uniref:hypothetical protein n=1 Tax=Vibrio mediterranei TaxID=689 RepID=UPI0020A3897A|nr:hypothetical protein [Vibrio mediterranei]
MYETRGIGADYIARVKQKLANGKEPMSEVDRLHIQEWVVKMLERARDGDLDGNYRRTWLQHDLLKMYFDIRGKWYLGSKKSFQYIKQNDSAIYSLFEQVYKNPLDIDLLDKLASKVVRI